MNNMIVRYLVAGIAIPLIVLMVIFAPSWVFDGFVVIIMLAALYEWLGLLNTMKLAVPMVLAMAMGLVLLCGIWMYSHLMDGFILFASVLLVLTGLCVFGLVNLHKDIKQKTLGNGSILMALFLCCWGGGSLILIRECEVLPDGRFWIMLLFALAWSGDAGAMHIGKLVGRHKLTPIISPKKTVEGLIGGILVATVVGVLAHMYFPYMIPRWHIFVLAPLTVVLAHVGDLTASMIKRAAGVKDSGRMIPGHGGCLDRFDNMLLTAPFFYVYVRILLG